MKGIESAWATSCLSYLLFLVDSSVLSVPSVAIQSTPAKFRLELKTGNAIQSGAEEYPDLLKGCEV